VHVGFKDWRMSIEASFDPRVEVAPQGELYPLGVKLYPGWRPSFCSFVLLNIIGSVTPEGERRGEQYP
jgi:hypothetical protein